MPVLIFLLLHVQSFHFYVRHANSSAKFPFKKTNPIINASFVFIVFLWLWCILPLEFRSQQQIKGLVTLLKDMGQPLNFKTHSTCFPGLWVGKSFVFLQNLSPLLYSYFILPSVSPPKTYWHPWEGTWLHALHGPREVVCSRNFGRYWCFCQYLPSWWGRNYKSV